MSDEGVPVEAADLDGHTLEELDDYLDRGRMPADPSIDDSPSCRIALAALERLRLAAAEMVDGPERPEAAARDEGWVRAALGRIPQDARPGRRFPLVRAPELEAVVTEGALRALVRAVGDDVAGLVMGRVRIDPDAAGESARVEVEVALVYGARLPDAAGDLDRALRDALARHLPFRLSALAIRVVDVIDLRGGTP